MGGATFISYAARDAVDISIHAPRGGSDNHLIGYFTPCGDFNPRSPWGERRVNPDKSDGVIIFQSTLPVGGATSAELDEQAAQVISIHAPRGGSDHAGE